MIKLEILGGSTIHTSRTITTIDCIDYLARNWRTLGLIPEEFPGVDKLHAHLFFQLTAALFFLEF